MSARLTPEELRAIAPEEYARLYGKPEERQARQAPPPRQKSRHRDKPPASFWVALVFALSQFALAIYVMARY